MEAVLFPTPRLCTEIVKFHGFLPHHNTTNKLPFLGLVFQPYIYKGSPSLKKVVKMTQWSTGFNASPDLVFNLLEQRTTDSCTPYRGPTTNSTPPLTLKDTGN
jgi:hypothetical protein